MAYVENYQDVIRLAYQTEQYWQRSKLDMIKGHQWYNLQIPITTPKGVEFAAPPTAPSLVNDAADHLAGNKPKYLVRSVTDFQKAQKDSDRLQSALNGFFDRLSKQFGKAIHRSLAIHGGWSGMMCARVLLKDGWDMDNPSWKDFYWQPVDPRFVFPDPGSLGGEFVIYRMRRTVGSIRQMWPDWEGQWYEAGTANAISGQKGMFKTRLPERLPDNYMVDWIEYWDDEVKCFVANGHPVFKERFGRDIIPHLLGTNPFIIRAAGYGDDNGEAYERFRSMLYWVFNLLEVEAKILYQYRWIIEDTAWPTFLAPMSMKGVDITPGTLNYVPDPEAIKAFRAVREDGVKPQAVIELLQYISGAIERATYPVVINGQAPQGIKAGYPIAILSTQAKLKFAAAADALQDMMQQLAEKTMIIVQSRIGEKVQSIEGFYIEPKDIDKYEGRITAQLEPNLPTDKAASLPILEFAVGSLGLPKAYALQELGFDHPLELREERVIEDMEDDPRARQFLLEHLMREMSPEYAAAMSEIIEPALAQQKAQDTTQQLQSQLQEIQMQMQMMQMMPQYQQMMAQMQQASQQGFQGMTPVSQQNSQQLSPAQMTSAQQTSLSQPVTGRPPQTVPGGPGGTLLGQNLQMPNNMGQSQEQINPMTAITAQAREMRGLRSIGDLSTQENVYGSPGGGL